MINNRISNLISRIRNTITSTHNGWIINQKDIYNSKEIIDLLAKLGELGYVNYQKGAWYINTKPDTYKPLIETIKGRSKSGKRIYRKSTKIGLNEIVRTSSGYLTGYEANTLRKGGELILKIENRGNRY